MFRSNKQFLVSFISRKITILKFYFKFLSVCLFMGDTVFPKLSQIRSQLFINDCVSSVNTRTIH